jgi:hypothetical protein
MPESAPAPLLATSADLHAILGELDERLMLEILALHPTVAELEEAAMWARGEGDLRAREGHPLDARLARLVDILTADEDEPEPRPPG